MLNIFEILFLSIILILFTYVSITFIKSSKNVNKLYILINIIQNI